MTIDHGAALYVYNKEGTIQDIIHKLKYRGRVDIGVNAGKLFASRYSESELFDRADIIVPIPSHFRRKLKRGYNQAYIFAKAISKATGIPVKTGILNKSKNQNTLTSQTRISRFEQVKQSFEIRRPSCIESKRVLLTDDVLTTGATLEAASQLLLQAGCKSVQWGLIAIAKN